MINFNHLLFVIRSLLTKARDDEGLSTSTTEEVEDSPAFVFRPSTLTDPTPSLPYGKGMFVRDLNKHCKSPKDMAEVCRLVGIEWVAIQGAWQYDDGKVRWANKDIGSYAVVLQANNIKVWVWGYAQPDLFGNFCSAMMDRAQAANALGVILDIEKPWIGQHNHIAIEFVEKMRDSLPRHMNVGFTSYGWPKNFKKLPWQGFAEEADFSIPQAYDTYNNMGPRYQYNSVDAYRKLGFRNIIPGLRTYSISSEQLLNIAKRTPTPSNAVVWWDWYSMTKDKWKALSEFSITSSSIS